MSKKSELAERIAALVTAPVNGVSVHTFNVDGRYLQTIEGENKFMTVRDVESLLRKRAAEVRAALETER